MDQPTESSDKTRKPSINDAISHFRSNLLESKGFPSSLSLSKRRFPTQQLGSGTQPSTSRLDAKSVFSSKDFSIKDFSIKDYLKKDFSGKYLSTKDISLKDFCSKDSRFYDKAAGRRPFHSFANYIDSDELFEYSGITSSNDNISQFIPESQTSFMGEGSAASLGCSDKVPLNQSISDILKHFKQPSLSTSKRVESIAPDLFDKFLRDIGSNTDQKSFFIDFIQIFKEKYKLSYAKLDIRVEKLCNSITAFLMDSTIINDSKTYETKQFIDKFDITIPLKQLIQPGYIDIRLLTLALMAYTLSLNNELKPINMKDCEVFNARSAQLYKDALIIQGDLLLPKPECLLFLNDTEAIKPSNDDFLDKFFLKKDKTVYFSRKKWYHRKSIFNDTCTSINPTMDSTFISEYLQRRSDIANVYSFIDDEFHKLDLSLNKFSTVHTSRRIDFNLTFLIIEPILLDFIVPHTIVPL